MNPETKSPPKDRAQINLPLGRLLSTPGAINAIAKAGQDGSVFLERHRAGDWGDIDQEDWAANDRAAVDGSRILSAYTLPDGTKIWIISESNRSATTILLPDEY
jgi:hypothetical protein